jgi:UDP-N-acetylglucosamine 2-epimerase (non-hydrolysing)
MTMAASYALSDNSIAVVLGTRPEIIKLAGIIRLLGPAALLVHTGQHYDPTLSDVFFAEIGLPEPDVHVGIGGESRGRQIGLAIQALDETFAERGPAAVVVEGDTNTVVAAALAANARGIPLVHIEAGLRSHDRRMPEEHNRVVTDHLADLLCAPTETSRVNLLNEGISDDAIVVTGNTVVEAVTELMPDEAARTAILERHGVAPNRYVLSTMHRPENVDVPHTLTTILTQLAEIPLPVVLPLHPRTVARVEAHGLGELLAKLIVVEPLGYRDFLGLGAESAFLISDSGGVQEEVSVYKRPALVVRRSTERPEVIGTFAERVVPGPDITRVAQTWIDDLPAMHARLAELPSPYGDGTASARSVEAIREMLRA